MSFRSASLEHILIRSVACMLFYYSFFFFYTAVNSSSTTTLYIITCYNYTVRCKTREVRVDAVAMLVLFYCSDCAWMSLS
ncbi:hypothetical protein JKP88DRAFT_33848 [Tribonema minus]|uniref:Uncharacterized protein n=1 Tax=Tribonema minus TaxID=303371 RepID=A0A835Z5E0_9STRA|nr:hypothetical protein JKP88DRAFT_33848 [Tribonema minus]